MYLLVRLSFQYEGACCSVGVALMPCTRVAEGFCFSPARFLGFFRYDCVLLNVDLLMPTVCLPSPHLVQAVQSCGYPSHVSRRQRC